MEDLLKILNEIKSNVDYQNEQHLIDDGILDSLDIVSLVSELNDFYKIEIELDDLVPENFNSVNAIMNLINRLKG